MISAEDIDKVIVPLGLFPSKDEPKDVVGLNLLSPLHYLISLDSMIRP